MTLRTDSQFATATEGLTNARTRIVGTRTGVLADSVVSIVRFALAVRDTVSRAATRAAQVVTPLGWTMVAIVPLGFVFGYSLRWLELVAVAWAGLIVLLIAALYLVGRSRLEVELELPHVRIGRAHV